MTANVHLSPELESFARSCVASGRFSSVNEVIRSSLRLLQEREERREKFNAMLNEVRQEVEREGTYELDEVLAQMDEVIRQAEG